MEPINIEIDGTQQQSAAALLVEEATQELASEPYDDQQPSYVPPELVKPWCSNDASVLYHCYLIQMKPNFCSDIPVNDIVLGMRSELDCDVANMNFDLGVGKSTITVNFKKAADIHLSSEQILQCRRFQITIFRILMDHNLQKLEEILERLSVGQNLEVESIDYLLLPAARMHQRPFIIDWECVMSVPFRSEENSEYHVDSSPPNNCSRVLHTKNGMVCTCRIQNSLVYTPHTGLLYCITGLLNDLNGNSRMRPRRRRARTYKTHYEEKHGIKLRFDQQLLLKGKFIFKLQNYLQSCRQQTEKDSSHTSVELPPELCSIVMSPLSVSNLYSFSFVPSIMHRLESLLLAVNLKRMVLDRCTENVTIPTIKGFIRNECFDPKKWIIPGDYSGSSFLNEKLPFNEKNIYIRGTRKIKGKRVADVVEALIGAFLSTGGEIAAIYFMNWVGIKVDLFHIPYERHFQVQPEKLIDVRHLEFLLNNYSFRDPSLLLEALTHGSYMLPQIPGCYERLEFLGDAVLDYVITAHLYHKYPDMSPGLLTDMRSASVNNICYARTAVRAGLHKHILASDSVLHTDIANTVNNFASLSAESTFGWESETYFSEVLADIIESLAGAIFVDSEYDKNAVFKSIRPLLEPLVSPETVPLNPVKEFHDYCQKMQYIMKKPVKSIQNGVATRTIEVEANGVVKYTHTSTASNNDTAKRLACREFLRLSKGN
ncbi:endoribonuclease Dicer homolog 2-like isoform X2 [Prunus dulcis]|uniref:endoribonuclease Dicer homolog 2-like isoform X2 n=1 Tax=Prunus dulcis TaxID=3755 RepID=UPI001483136C|nr:endoribonuclease Dicer homolog 2-like isoform X2 [Prunus dulcis]